jgi:hypothetical protein
MGIFKKVVKAAGYGGDQVCKYCGEKKTVLSAYTCKGTTRTHKWIKQ